MIMYKQRFINLRAKSKRRENECSMISSKMTTPTVMAFELSKEIMDDTNT